MLLELLLSSGFLVLTIILYLLGMHRATAASAISQSLLTNRRRSPHLLFTADFPNNFNALILEDVLADLHKHILPYYYVIKGIRLFFTKHYWGLFAASKCCPCHTVQKNTVDNHPVSMASLYRLTHWCSH